MTTLQRNLGLSAVFTVSIGAMIGSGIFVLPGLADKVAGPAAVLAYVLAGIVVIPAAVSQSELATAMPRAGGAYLFIDRAMGPLVGTVAGFGVWFALIFKSAFALVGLGAYLDFFVRLPAQAVGITLALLLCAINIMGVKQSGRFQTVVVLSVLSMLGFFVITGGINVEAANLAPFMPEGWSGLLSATGLVFVSYAGVTKVASVAEEVKDPGRTLPRGMLGSIFLMLILYPAIMLVIAGNLPQGVLADDLAPVADAAALFLGPVGADIISATAIFALLSMANAGLLSSSRYPFAMARNQLAPAPLASIYPRTGTPAASIALTGLTMVALIAFVPLIQLAKLASAFQVVVFCLINLSLIAFREAHPAWYRPKFRSPFYPWLQLFGIASSLLLLTQLGWISILGSVGMVAAGAFWYRVFGRSRASHESAALDALRLRSIGPLVTTTEAALASPGRNHVAIAVDGTTSNTRLRDLLRIAKAVTAEDGRITLTRMDRIRSGSLWWRRLEPPRADDPFRLGAKDIANELEVDIALVRPTGADPGAALLEYARRHAVDLILSHINAGTRARTRFDPLWLQTHAEADVMLLGNDDLGELGTITVLGAGSPYDVAKIDTAYRLGHAERAEVQLLHVLGENANEPQQEAVAGYHRQLMEFSPVETHSDIGISDDLVQAIIQRARHSDLVVMGASRAGIGPELSQRISEAVEAPVLVVQAPPDDENWRKRILHRLIY